MSELEITDHEFAVFQQLAQRLVGIHLPDEKKYLLLSRFTSRIKALGLQTFAEYLEFIRQDSEKSGVELSFLINKMTTNETYFFREMVHFDFLTHVALPQAQAKGKMRIWSAACSSGEEPYSIAITVEEFFLHQNKRFQVQILASDVNSEVLAKAQTGKYGANSFRGKTNTQILDKYFHHQNDDLVVDDAIRSKVVFKQINLLSPHFPLKEKLDIIFCRNVMIYFNQPTKEQILQKFHHYLATDGYLILGHSENLMGTGHQFQLLKNTIYQKMAGPVK